MAMLKRDQEGFYTDGRLIRLPSVTKIIGEVFRPYERIPKGILEQAANYGRAVHSMIHLDSKDILDESILDENLRPALNEWHQFCSDHAVKIRPEMCELTVACPRIGYAGTLDVLAMAKNKYCLIDIKTRDFSPLCDPLQLAAYCEAYREEYKSRAVPDRFIVSLIPGKKYKITKCENGFEHDLSVFRCVLATWGWAKKYGLSA